MNKFGRVLYRGIVLILLFIIAYDVEAIANDMGELVPPIDPMRIFIILMIGLIASIASEDLREGQ